MDRATFLKELRIALQGQISQEKVNEHLRYYENYIIEESRKGRTESQVIEDLGNPRLIAKTIIDTTVDTDQGSREDEVSAARRHRVFQYAKNFLFFVVLLLVLLVIARVAIALLPVFIPILFAATMVYFLFFSNRK